MNALNKCIKVFMLYAVQGIITPKVSMSRFFEKKSQ